MNEALAGLIGAVVGGALTSGSNIALEAIRSRRAARLATQAEARQSRQVRRLVDDELVAAAARLSELGLRRTWPQVAEPLSTRHWRSYGPVLAASAIDDDTWAWLADAYQAVHEANARIATAHARTELQIEPDDADHLAGIAGSIQQALEQLRKAGTEESTIHAMQSSPNAGEAPP